MSTLGDAALIVGPFVTALAGAYTGARLQAQGRADEELRAVMDRALPSLTRLARALGTSRAHFIADGADTSEVGADAMRDLDIALVDAQEFRDIILVRTPAESPISIHYINVLLAAGRGVDALKDPYFWPSAHADRFTDLAKVLKGIRQSEEDFGEERAALIAAAQRRLSPSSLKARLRGKVPRRRRPSNS